MMVLGSGHTREHEVRTAGGEEGRSYRGRRQPASAPAVGCWGSKGPSREVTGFAKFEDKSEGRCPEG